MVVSQDGLQNRLEDRPPEQSETMQGQFVRVEDCIVLERRLNLCATQDEMRQVENGLRKRLISTEAAHQNLEQCLQETNKRLEAVLQSCNIVLQTCTPLAGDPEKMQQQIQQRTNELNSQLKSACREVLLEETGVGLAELRRHVDKIEASLPHDIQKLTTTHAEEARLWQISMQEMQAKQWLMATKSEQIQQQIHGLDSRLKSAEEDRSAVKKAINTTLLRLSESVKGSPDSTGRWRKDLERMLQEQQRRIDSGLATLCDKIKRTEGSLHEEIGSGLAGLRRHLDQTEGSLVHDIQELMTNHKEEVRLRQLSMQEMCTKQFQHNSLISTKCEALRVDFTNEQKYTRSKLQPIKDIITDIKGDSEKMQQQIEEQIHAFEYGRCLEELPELRRHVDQIAGSLGRDIQKITTTHMEEARLQRISMQEMHAKHWLMATKCEALKVDLTNEQIYTRGERQSVKDLLTDMKINSEEVQQQIQQKIQGLDSQLKSAGRERGDLKKAHDDTLQRLTEKIERTEGSLHEEIGNGLAGLCRHVNHIEGLLGHHIQELTTSHKEEVRLRQLGMQEMYEKYFQDDSLMGTRCEAGFECLHTPAVTHANLEEWRDYYSQEYCAGDKEIHLVTKYSMDQDDQDTEDGTTSDGMTSDDLTIASLNQELVESMKRVENLETDLKGKCELIKSFQVR